jgi:hypothetical protein
MKKSAMLTAAIGNLDMGMATRVAQEAVLEEIYLVDAKISRDPLIVYPEALSLEHKCSTEVLSHDKDKKLSFILCNFRVAAFSSAAPDKLAMKIEAAFCTSYVHKSLPDESPDDDLVDLLDHFDYWQYCFTINPISNAWPYWREFVQNMSSRMGFPALTVPLLKIAMKTSAAKKAKRQPAKKESARRGKVIA